MQRLDASPWVIDICFIFYQEYVHDPEPLLGFHLNPTLPFAFKVCGIKVDFIYHIITVHHTVGRQLSVSCEKFSLFFLLVSWNPLLQAKFLVSKQRMLQQQARQGTASCRQFHLQYIFLLLSVCFPQACLSLQSLFPPASLLHDQVIFKPSVSKVIKYHCEAFGNRFSSVNKTSSSFAALLKHLYSCHVFRIVVPFLNCVGIFIP